MRLARAVGRTEIHLVLLIGGVTGPAGVRPPAAALGNFCFRTKPLCWLRELESRQRASLKDFYPLFEPFPEILQQTLADGRILLPEEFPVSCPAGTSHLEAQSNNARAVLEGWLVL